MSSLKLESGRVKMNALHLILIHQSAPVCLFMEYDKDIKGKFVPCMCTYKIH